jgi:uncharacterized protein (TIGR02145 family)
MKKIILLFASLAFLTLSNQAQTVTDVDGNVYSTVTIGKQVWLNEDLEVTHYRNGDSIPNVHKNKVWKGLETGAYCYWANFYQAGGIDTKLYNYYTVVDSRNLCPSGWHIPTDEEWTAMIDYLGGERKAGLKLQSSGKVWSSPLFGKNGESGFNANPHGFRLKNGQFSASNNSAGFGEWWSVTEKDVNKIWCRRMACGINPKIKRDDEAKSCGFSVRCVKDN